MVGVVTQPDRPRGRGRRRSPSPVAERAERAGVPLLRPERVGSASSLEALAQLAPDLGVVVAFGQFLPRRVRELPSCGFLINAHASLLPKYRGAAPIPHALWAGEAETGISVMRIEKEMDAGPVALALRTAIAAKETAGELEQRLAQLAADAIEAVVEQIGEGRISWTEQDHARATLAPKLTAELAELDFARPAEVLERQVRAMAPRPGAFTWRHGERLRILAADVVPGRLDAKPGTVRTVKDELCIATGDGWLAPRRLQRAGAKALAVAEFQRGRALLDGEQLGAAP